jgi:hypothetical protein
VGQNRTPVDSAVQAWPNGCGPPAATAADGAASADAAQSAANHGQRCLVLDISRLLPACDSIVDRICSGPVPGRSPNRPDYPTLPGRCTNINALVQF